MIDCELPEFYSVKDVVARKEHKCCECGGSIHPKESYVRCTGKWDGEISTYRQHQECAEMCRSLSGSSICDGCVPFGFLHDELWECFRWNDRKKDWNKRQRSALANLILKRTHWKEDLRGWFVEGDS